MNSLRRTLAALSASTLLAPLLLTTGAPAAAKRADPPDPQLKAAAVAVAWQRVALRTVYVDRVTPPPVGTLYLSFTSQAVYEAAREAHRHGRVAATTAVATAAHDVLSAFFPSSGAALDADLTSHLAQIPDGPKADLGESIGAAAARAMVASRLNDGREATNTSIPYTLAAAPGVWQPPPTMNPTWLGFVKPVVDIEPVVLNGPDGLRSAAYTADWDEVRRLGSAGSTERLEDQTEIALFFGNNPVLMYRDALCRYLDAEPLGLIPVTRMFARIDAAVAMSMIQSWKWKFGVGFWRPSQAIPLAGTDGNPATTPEGNWAALLPVPPYPEYTSGHANATSPFAEVLRQTLGDDVPLVLRALNREDRPYATLSALEHDALNSRIWGGLHFRDAMDDGYYLGHRTARRVMDAIR